MNNSREEKKKILFKFFNELYEVDSRLSGLKKSYHEEIAKLKKTKRGCSRCKKNAVIKKYKNLINKILEKDE